MVQVHQPGKARLKRSVYVWTEPTTGAYVALRGETPRVVEALHLATLFPACERGLVAMAAAAARHPGAMIELLRVDPW